MAAYLTMCCNVKIEKKIAEKDERSNCVLFFPTEMLSSDSH